MAEAPEADQAGVEQSLPPMAQGEEGAAEAVLPPEAMPFLHATEAEDEDEDAEESHGDASPETSKKKSPDSSPAVRQSKTDQSRQKINFRNLKYSQHVADETFPRMTKELIAGDLRGHNASIEFLNEQTSRDCHLYLRSDLPEKLTVRGHGKLDIFLNCYILIKSEKTLYYIKPDGIPERVNIQDFARFHQNLRQLEEQGDEKLLLSEQQVEDFITSNGGHIPHKGILPPPHILQILIKKFQNWRLGSLRDAEKFYKAIKSKYKDLIAQPIAQGIHSEMMEVHRVKQGIYLHVMRSFPENFTPYRNSYILIKATQQLLYVNPNGEPEAVRIQDFALFDQRNFGKETVLSEQDIEELITANGGHAPKQTIKETIEEKLMGIYTEYPSDHTYNMRLVMHLGFEEYSEVFRLFDDMDDMRVTPVKFKKDSWTYGTYFTAKRRERYGDRSNSLEAYEEIYQELPEAVKLEPTIVKTIERKRAERSPETMQAFFDAIPPEALTDDDYRSLMRAYFSKKAFPQAMRVYDLWLANPQIEKTEATFSSIIDQYYEQDRMKTQEIYRESLRQGAFIDNEIFQEIKSANLIEMEINFHRIGSLAGGRATYGTCSKFVMHVILYELKQTVDRLQLEYPSAAIHIVLIPGAGKEVNCIRLKEVWETKFPSKYPLNDVTGNRGALEATLPPDPIKKFIPRQRREVLPQPQQTETGTPAAAPSASRDQTSTAPARYTSWRERKSALYQPSSASSAKAAAAPADDNPKAPTSLPS